MGEQQWNGDERRDMPMALLIYKLEVTEKKIGELEKAVLDLTLGFTKMKQEMLTLAKSESRSSGLVYGVVSAVATGIAMRYIDK